MWIFLVLIIIVVGTIIWQNEADDMNRMVYDATMKKGEELRRQFANKGELKYFCYFINHEYFVVVDNFLHVNINGRKGKTNINNIMTTEIKYHVSEKNRMRFMAVMPTYDKYTKLVAVELILYRRGREDVNFILDPNIVNDQDIKKLKMILDEMIEEGKVSDKS